jgi:hypothetical protein
MRFKFKLILIVLFNLSFFQNSFSDNHNIYETLEIIKNDLKTLERAVYSGSIEISASTNQQSNIDLDSNSGRCVDKTFIKII